jgi:hypothetical protein
VLKRTAGSAAERIRRDPRELLALAMAPLQN